MKIGFGGMRFFRVWNDDPSLRVNDRARLEGGGCRRFDGSL